MFSNYKNTVTGKALIGISPHGMGLLFSDIYPGSISDSEITEKSGVINYVEQEHEIMSDRGFSIQEYCTVKGITLNRPKQKENDQFDQSDVAANFDIAATRIHVERFIGRVRDWAILNAVWPLNQMDLLSSTWQMLCQIVNITQPPIGPKHYGVNGNMLKWFSNYLTNRKQYIQYDKTNRTECLNTKCGVPQGSILGPLLFLLYINDLHQASKIIKPIMFADDTNFFYSHMNIKTLFDTVNKELNNVNEWFKANKLSLNTKKN